VFERVPLSGHDWGHLDGLTRGEMNTLRLICRGMTNTEAARTMHRTRRAVEWHVRHLHRAFGGRERTGDRVLTPMPGLGDAWAWESTASCRRHVAGTAQRRRRVAAPAAKATRLKAAGKPLATRAGTADPGAWERRSQGSGWNVGQGGMAGTEHRAADGAHGLGCPEHEGRDVLRRRTRVLLCSGHRC